MWAVPIGFCFPILLAGTCMQHLYEGACIKVWNSFLILILKTGPYPILEPSTELNPARISFFWRGAKKCLHLLPTVFLRNSTERVDPPLPFVLATYPKVSSPRAPRRRQRKQPACCGGAAFFFTIRPGRLSLPSVAYEFTSIPGWVQFPFDFSLVAVTRIRASVSTPPKLTWRGIHSREQTQPLHTPRSTPSCISIQDPSRRVEVLRGTHYSEYPPQKRCVCQVRFVLVGLGGFDQKCYAYAQDYPSSRKLRGDYFTTDDRP